MAKFILVFFISFTVHAQSSKYLELDLEQCLQIALENNLQLEILLSFVLYHPHAINKV